MTPAFRRALRFAPWIKLFGGVGLVRRKIKSLLVASSGDPAWVTDEVVYGYTAGAARDLDATLKAYVAMANAREPGKLWPHLSEIRCPVRLMVGGVAHEGDVGATEVKVLQRTLRSFALDSVPGAGHFIQEEQPLAVVAAIARVRAALDRRP